ncbi:MAG: hypothetical protein CO088_01425 [Candidatus Yonathbacteria bacterium CG_4_9_14_0_8_um_filter_46_47]|uniref:Uncharacterized protein n=2 Tax=Parcubacteria group TaxID=1794811 RepID=A0A2M8D8K1_9BACT|nr:MAG: hypothetical protein CO088_01425 [Candidatus Yonathbacteria bacterium CG_4_9_14_0_8_um_filter_46_47]
MSHMKTDTKIKRTILVFVILLVGVGLAWFSFFSPKAQERHINKEITKASYCEVASDCQMVAQSQCPFGCYVHVNKNEATRIGELLESYESNCQYMCIEFKGVDCINNSCQLIK